MSCEISSFQHSICFVTQVFFSYITSTKCLEFLINPFRSSCIFLVSKTSKPCWLKMSSRKEFGVPPLEHPDCDHQLRLFDISRGLPAYVECPSGWLHSLSHHRIFAHNHDDQHELRVVVHQLQGHWQRQQVCGGQFRRGVWETEIPVRFLKYNLMLLGFLLNILMYTMYTDFSAVFK